MQMFCDASKHKKKQPKFMCVCVCLLLTHKKSSEKCLDFCVFSVAFKRVAYANQKKKRNDGKHVELKKIYY